MQHYSLNLSLSRVTTTINQSVQHLCYHATSPSNIRSFSAPFCCFACCRELLARVLLPRVSSLSRCYRVETLFCAAFLGRFASSARVRYRILLPEVAHSRSAKLVKFKRLWSFVVRRHSRVFLHNPLQFVPVFLCTRSCVLCSRDSIVQQICLFSVWCSLSCEVLHSIATRDLPPSGSSQGIWTDIATSD